MSEHKVREEHEKAQAERAWVVVAAGGQSYIGVPIPEREAVPIAALARPCAALARLYVGRDGWIALKPCYELHAQLLRDTRGQTGRLPQAVNADVILTPEHAPVYLRADRFYFLADLAEEDRKEYLKLIAEAEKQVQAARAMRSSGLVLDPDARLRS